MRQHWRDDVAIAVSCVLAVASLLGVVRVDAQTMAAPVSARDSTIVATADRAMHDALRELRVPGGVLVVVRQGQVLAKRAYGVADVETQRAVSLDSTVFRLASVSKVFAGIAALQLRDRRVLGIDSDLRSSLPEVSNSASVSSKALTMRQLLTHTAGIDDRLVGYLAPMTAPARPLAVVVRELRTTRDRDDTTMPGYANVGTAIAALAMERMVKASFHTFVDSTLFAPLGMRSTSHVLPGNATMLSRLASEYRYSGARPPLTYSPTYPAGNIGSTASDMARLLVAWQTHTLPALADSSYALLDSALVYELGMPPMGLARSYALRRGVRVAMKGGASRSHSALVARFPDIDVDLFVAVNRQEPQVWERVVDALSDSLSRWGLAVSRDSVVTPLVVKGAFRWTRAASHGYEKVLGLASQIQANPIANGVRITGPILTGDYTQRGARRFVSERGDELVVRTTSGMPSVVFGIVQGQPVTLIRISWWERATVQLSAWFGAVVISLVLALAAAARTKWSAQLRTWERGLAIVFGLGHIVLVVALIMLLRDSDALALGPTGALRLALIDATGLGLMSLAVVVVGARSLVTSASRARRVQASNLLLIVSGIITVAVLALNDTLGYAVS